MDSGYYTDPPVNGGEESEDSTPPSDHTPATDSTPPSGPTINHARAKPKSAHGRSKNFRDEEDILLVSAWLNVGMDPIQGVDQSHGTLWTRIHDYFHSNKTFKSNRSESSLLSRWSSIQHDVYLFCECLSRIEQRNHSGWIVDDMITNACAMFKEEDKNNRKFAYLHCWRILKEKPKWMKRRREIGAAKNTGNKKQKIVPNSSASGAALALAPAAPLAGDAHGEPSARPDGKKEEKQKLRQCSTIEAVDYLMAKNKEVDHEKDLNKEERCKCNKAFAMEEERIKLEKEKFEFQRDMEEERIIGLDLSTMNHKQKQYYEMRQNEILARHCNI